MSDLISAGREHNCNYQTSSGPYFASKAGCIALSDRIDAFVLRATCPPSGLSFTTEYTMPFLSVETDGYLRIIGDDCPGSGAFHRSGLSPLFGAGVGEVEIATVNCRW